MHYKCLCQFTQIYVYVNTCKKKLFLRITSRHTINSACVENVKPYFKKLFAKIITCIGL